MRSQVYIVFVSAALNAPERNSGSNWYGALFGSLLEVVEKSAVAVCAPDVSSSVPSCVVDQPFSVVTSKGLNGLSDEPMRMKGVLKLIEVILHHGPELIRSWKQNAHPRL